MSGERFDPPVVQELEQELRQALTLEPSPDFGRQVRARIERRPTKWRAPWSFGWPAALAAAAVCVVAVGLAWRVTREPVEVRGVSITPRAGVDVALTPEGTFDAPVPVATKVVNPRAVHAPKSVEPEVIVPPEPARALAMLVELVRRDVVDEERLRPQARAVSAAMLTIAPLAVPPIPVTEIDVQNSAARGGSDRQ